MTPAADFSSPARAATGLSEGQPLKSFRFRQACPLRRRAARLGLLSAGGAEYPRAPINGRGFGFAVGRSQTADTAADESTVSARRLR
jgi:hypothetical protein